MHRVCCPIARWSVAIADRLYRGLPCPPVYSCKPLLCADTGPTSASQEPVGCHEGGHADVRLLHSSGSNSHTAGLHGELQQRDTAAHWCSHCIRWCDQAVRARHVVLWQSTGVVQLLHLQLRCNGKALKEHIAGHKLVTGCSLAMLLSHAERCCCCNHYCCCSSLRRLTCLLLA